MVPVLAALKKLFLVATVQNHQAEWTCSIIRHWKRLSIIYKGHKCPSARVAFFHRNTLNPLSFIPLQRCIVGPKRTPHFHLTIFCFYWFWSSTVDLNKLQLLRSWQTQSKETHNSYFLLPFIFFFKRCALKSFGFVLNILTRWMDCKQRGVLNLPQSARTVTKRSVSLFGQQPFRSSEYNLCLHHKTELKQWSVCSACVDVLLSWHVHNWIWINKNKRVDDISGWTPSRVLFVILLI